MNNRPLISLKNLSKKFGKDIALNNVNLELPNKGLIGIVGNSGSGKSTLLRILSGLDVNYKGSVKVDGHELKKLSEAERSKLRLHQIGYVFQDYRLIELETVYENVLAPIEAIYDAKGEELRQKTLDLLSFVGLEDKAKQRVNTLSGGEKQRVALARSLASDPKILLADEPTGALDEASSQMVFSLLRGIAKNTLVLLITHDKEGASPYCDQIIHIFDGKIIDNLTQNDRPEATTPASWKIEQRKTANNLGFRFCFRHAFSLAKAKAFRTLVSEGAIAIGLGALGIVTYVVGSIQNEIQASFSSLIPESSIIMESRDENASPVGNIYAGRNEDAAFLTDEYPDMIVDYGSCLSLDYENWFIDDNYFSYQAGASYQILPGFTVRHINDYLWYSPGGKEIVYPRAATNMRTDQVILGLPYAAMFSTCLSFHIQRTYQALGDYISSQGWDIILHASHIDWGFEDEELFEVIGVIQTDVPLLFHSDHHWNTKILLDHMKFRSSQTEEVISPQYVMEIPYLELSCELEDFRKLCRKEEEMSRFIFEHVNSSYHPSFCVPGKRCEQNRLFLYSCDKSGALWSDIERIQNESPLIEGRNIISSGGYYAPSSAVMNGFLGKAFLGCDEEKLFEVSETFADLPLDQAELAMSLPSNVMDASYLAMGDSALRISAAKPALTSGREPEGLEECVLSETLYSRLGQPEIVFFALEISHEEIGDRYHREFRTVPIKVVGVAKEDFATMFVISDWTSDAPFALFDMSPFLLEPTGAMFFAEKGSDTAALVERLNREYPRYRFVDPSLEIGSSIASTLDYISVVLYAFSAIALVMSGLLFVITMALSLGESSHEGRLFFALGLPRTTLLRLSFSQCVLLIGLGLVASCLLTLGAELGVKFYLGSTFGSGIRGSLSPFPFLWIAIAASSFLILAFLVLAGRAKMRDFT